MVRKGKNRDDRAWSERRPHEEFLQLCAVSTTGELSDEEQRVLQEHVSICPRCREALGEFELAAHIAGPLLSSEMARPSSQASLSPQSHDAVPDSTPRPVGSSSASGRTGEGRDFSCS